MLMRVNLFDPWRKPIYGTATAKDILEVSLASLGFFWLWERFRFFHLFREPDPVKTPLATTERTRPQ